MAALKRLNCECIGSTRRPDLLPREGGLIVLERRPPCTRDPEQTLERSWTEVQAPQPEASRSPDYREGILPSLLPGQDPKSSGVVICCTDADNSTANFSSRSESMESGAGCSIREAAARINGGHAQDAATVIRTWDARARRVSSSYIMLLSCYCHAIVTQISPSSCVRLSRPSSRLKVVKVKSWAA